MILILANLQDDTAPFVTRKLDALGAPYLRFNPRDFPSAAEISISYDRSGAVRRTLNYHPEQREIDLAQVTAVWNRARARPVADARVQEEHRWWVAESCSRFIAELWECVDCLWLPNRPVADRDPHRVNDPQRVLEPQDKAGDLPQPPRLGAPSGYNKLHQLAVAGRVGFTVPRTLVTNSPERFLEFYEKCERQVISKDSTQLLQMTRKGEKHLAYTYPVQRRNAANYQSIRYMPVMFQENVPKKLEVRATVVGNKVFAAAIRSQENHKLLHDWRHYPDFGLAKFYSVHTLPTKVEELCVRVVKALGLCFGAIDLILTPADEYVFLEVNPNGQWAWIEEFTGLPISDAIAEVLMRGTA